MSSGTKKIMVLLSGLAMGGAERQTLDLMRGLLDLGYDPHLVVVGNVRSSAFDDNIFVNQGTHIEARGLSAPDAWKGVARLIASGDFSHVIAVNQTATILAAGAKLISTKPIRIISVLHSTILPFGPETVRFLIYRFALLFCTCLVYVSEMQRKYWAGRLLWCRGNRAIVNGIDLDRFAATDEAKQQIRRKYMPDENGVLVGVLASLRPEKRIDIAIEAVARVHAAGVNIRLLIVGAGREGERLRALVAERDLGGCVEFLGEMSDVRQVIPGIDMGLIVSDAVETLSIAALEQLACGVPMCMTDIGGAREIITPGENGYLVEAGSIDAVAAALEDFSHKGLRRTMSAEALKSSKRFDRARMVASYAEILG